MKTLFQDYLENNLRLKLSVFYLGAPQIQIHDNTRPVNPLFRLMEEPPSYPWLPPTFLDPVPAKHRERLQRAQAKNMEFVLRKDVEERQRVIDALKNDGSGDIFIDYSGRGAKRSRDHWRPLDKEKRTGGIGSAEIPTGPRDSRHASIQSVRGSRSSGPTTAIYVSGLPPSVTQAQLGQLFSPYGRVRRIKIYRITGHPSARDVDDSGQPLGAEEQAQAREPDRELGPDREPEARYGATGEVEDGQGVMPEAPSSDRSAMKGIPKGDALVTFMKPGSVGTAIKKLNGVAITAVGGGAYRLSVQAADFSHKIEIGKKVGRGGGKSFDDAESTPPADGVLGASLFDEAGLSMFQPLPPECRGGDRPTCVLRNLYTGEQVGGQGTERFLNGLEAEILVECLKFGSVICCLALPEAPYYHGSVLVTFGPSQCAAATITPASDAKAASPAVAISSAVAAAEACHEAMDGRLFDGSTIRVQALGNWGNGEILPGAPPGGPSQELSTSHVGTADVAIAVAVASAAPALDE